MTLESATYEFRTPSFEGESDVDRYARVPAPTPHRGVVPHRPAVRRARPDPDVTARAEKPGLRPFEVAQVVMEGYAQRPAIGQRAVEFVTDSRTGRTSAELRPHFDTLTYREAWDRAGALAAALADDSVRPGDRICVLGFASVDYALVDMALTRLAAVAVPLQASATAAQLRPVVAETRPTVIASSIDHLAAAVELARTAGPVRLIVFDYHPQVDDQRALFESAVARLAGADEPVTVEDLADVMTRGAALPPARVPPAGESDPLALLIYTSGSTGAPKGAMITERLVADQWRASTSERWGQRGAEPAIALGFMPMSHIMGRAILYTALARGGTVFFAARSDLSTLLDDLALVRPTQLAFVPRIWEMLFQRFRSDVQRRIADGAARAGAEAAVTADLGRNLLGGRFLAATTGSAPISPELRTWVESFLDLHLVDGYGSTEAGSIAVDGRVRRPPVVDYRLEDVGDLGYFRTDRPYPRGELLIRSEALIPGYYRRPDATAEVFDADGWYHTGDIFAEVGADQLVYLDRRSFVLKLSQGEFVTVSKVEAAFTESPLVRQIYIYGNSTRSYPLAVVVPTEAAWERTGGDTGALKPLIAGSLHEVAKSAGLQSYEIPRDFLVETQPFSPENGLLTGIRKLARPNLKQRYGSRLEQLYTDLAEAEAGELRALHRSVDRPVLETVVRAAGALLGAATGDMRPDAHFTDLGGDSLSALTFAQLLREIFDIDVPVGFIISPATDLRALADYLEEQRGGARRPTFAAVHGAGATEVHARDLTLDKFLDPGTIAAAPNLPGPGATPRTVLLTGATGFLGRYLALEWLERLARSGGTLICLVRARDDAAARARLDGIFDTGDPELSARYRETAAGHLEVVAGDKSAADLGLDHATWQRLADTVDAIVDPAALVNHVLPYSELFGPNVVGTAELIRLALTTKQKPYTYISTIGVSDQIGRAAFTEDADIRVISPDRSVDGGYANGYSNSKWAGEVLLRETSDLCGLPVTVFRCDMILADIGYAGQLNLPDMFTRLMLSLEATGTAPGSFYELDPDGRRQRAHYDGLPVGFIAEAVATLGARAASGFRTYHVMNPYDDGISLDTYVDWLIEAGRPIERISGYDTWLQRFETAVRALPDRQRRYSLLPLLDNYRKPQQVIHGSIAPTERFRTAVRGAEIGSAKDIPHVTPEIIVKYATDLELLGLL
ncbi:fatty-acid--CoA ligase FadD9 [Nocardia jinanensis]|uniref:Carboxylic acid reductase n=1 Tax=Nocardia jinanensis TaxID=382504 RepID=A0A917RUF6_9NOCA|nr:fatty-acid--CoA ligase FadD9 [Nocardia jinanensis]